MNAAPQLSPLLYVLFRWYFAGSTPGFLKIVDETLIINPLSGHSGYPQSPVPSRGSRIPLGAPQPRTFPAARDLRGPQGAAGGSLRRWISSFSISSPSPAARPPLGTKLNLTGSFLLPFSPPRLLCLASGRARSSSERHRAAPRRPRPHFKYGRRAAARPAGSAALAGTGPPRDAAAAAALSPPARHPPPPRILRGAPRLPAVTAAAAALPLTLGAGTTAAAAGGREQSGRERSARPALPRIGGGGGSAGAPPLGLAGADAPASPEMKEV